MSFAVVGVAGIALGLVLIVGAQRVSALLRRAQRLTGVELNDFSPRALRVWGGVYVVAGTALIGVALVWIAPVGSP